MEKQIKKIVDIFSKFPTIGERTATRFALYLLSLPKEEIDKICQEIIDFKNEIKLCSFCFNPVSIKTSSIATEEKEEQLCPICQDKKRSKLLCVVEKETDLWQMEKMKKYNGRYFILGGKMDFLKENSLGKMRIEELKKRVKKAKPNEIILAINPTSDGILTMNYILKILKPLTCDEQSQTIKITRLGTGLPINGEIEYADYETIEKALEGRA